MKQNRQSGQEAISCVLTPAPLNLSKLREHFRQKYSLTDPQVEIMVVSSSKSLQQGLGQLMEMLSQEESVEQLQGIYHGLKGLLLNMGEAEWAEYLRVIEQKLLTREPIDHRRIGEVLRDGMVNVLNYCEA